jgi:hypothetical protein
MDISELQLIDLKEFMEKGFLQEANRLFFNPLGIAMVFNLDENDDVVSIGFYQDNNCEYGFLFEENFLTKTEHVKKANFIKELKDSKIKTRVKYGCDEDGVQRIKLLVN